MPPTPRDTGPARSALRALGLLARGRPMTPAARPAALVSAVVRHPPTYGCRAGQRLPLHAASRGKAVLAAMPEAEPGRWRAEFGRQAFTPRTITGADALNVALPGVRHSGAAEARLRMGGAPC